MEQDYTQMTNQQLIDAFKKYQEKTNVSRSNIGFYIRNHNKDLYNEIVRRTLKLNQYKVVNKNKIREVSIFERLYCLEHNLDDRPMCKLCGKQHVAGFNMSTNKYGEYCSQKCQRHSPYCIQKGIALKKKRYGEDNITNNKKAKQTRIKRYGSYHPNDYANKVKATKKHRYGNENYVNVQKMLDTVERNKKENPSYYYDREQKAKQTKVANGHEPNWNNRGKFKETITAFSNEKKEDIIEKRRQTCLNDYGVESVAQLYSVKQQKNETCLDRYGKTTFLATKECQTKAKIAKKKQAWDYFTKECKDIQPLFTEEEFVNCQMNESQKIWRWKCKKCGYEFFATWANWQTRKCSKCFPQNYRGMQNEVENFMRTLCVGHIVRSDCKNVLDNSRQLDIYIEDLKLAIEFNGIFWHNSDIGAHGKNPTPMMYHYSKSIECQSKGIQLVHIFEDEWRDNVKLCKSKLKKIAFPEKVMHIDADLCNVTKDISNEMKHKMLHKYSFYGNDGSSIHYGLIYNRHLVAMMTLSKARNNQNQCKWQILNYVELNSFIIDNGFGKLLDEFVKDFKADRIRLYASFDWITKDTYSKWMNFIGLQDPRLYWVHNGQRIKGTAISTNNASSILKSYDAEKSFQQNMNGNGYLRIYDSGTLVFEK